MRIASVHCTLHTRSQNDISETGVYTLALARYRDSEEIRTILPTRSFDYVRLDASHDRRKKFIDCLPVLTDR